MKHADALNCLTPEVSPETASLSQRSGLAAAIRKALLCGSVFVTTAQAQVFPLSGLDGSNGIRIDGVVRNAQSGYSVSGAGDVNADGVDDVIIGVPNYNQPDSECAYVVFGRSDVGSIPDVLSVSSLSGSNGFRLNRVDSYSYCGQSVAAAGDVNGDGIDDLIVGVPNATGPNGPVSGSSYIVFGRSGVAAFEPIIKLSALDGTTGFRLYGAAPTDRSGGSVAGAGDINGDGIDDVVIGATLADTNGAESGAGYVVFGRSGVTPFASNIDLGTLDGIVGFRFDGAQGGDLVGVSVASAGDVNGDGVGDLIVGAFSANSNGNNSGSSYVVFGRSGAATYASSLNLGTLDGVVGFRLDGAAAGDSSGESVATAGDINGDGIDDLLIGARHADPNGGKSGSSYVVFGRNSTSPFASSIGLGQLNGSDGFRLDGVAEQDYSGQSVAAAGDFNGDGLDDLIIGAPLTDREFTLMGSSYIVFGRAGVASFPAIMNLSTLDGTNGLRLDGATHNERSGFSVASAGDFNGDGLSDVIIGAPRAHSATQAYTGKSYIVFGNDTVFGDGFE